jgi:hypothetical protein
MRRLKHVESRIRGWLPKEPELSIFHKISNSGVPQQKSFQVKGQAEKSLLDLFNYETGEHPRLTYYLSLIFFPPLTLAVVYIWFFMWSPSEGWLLLGPRLWAVLIYLPLGYQAISQSRTKLELRQKLKDGLANAAHSLLKYYDELYKSRRNFLLFDCALCLSFFVYWLIYSFLGYPMLGVEKFLMYIMLGFGIALAVVPFWERRTREIKRAKVQNLLSQLEHSKPCNEQGLKA